MSQSNWAPPGQQTALPPSPRSRYDFWTRGPGLIVLIVLAGLLAVGVIALNLARDRKPADPMNGFAVAVVGCEFSHDEGGGADGLTNVIVNYTVKNNHEDSRIATVQIEYRDDGGHLVDRDSSRTKWIGVGDTVRGVEMTSLDVPVKTGTCTIVGAN